MKIYVGNLTERTTAEEVLDLFSRYGTVEDAYIVKERETGTSRGFGFVFMKNTVEARAAMAALNGYSYEGKPITVSPPKEKAPKKAVSSRPPRSRGAASSHRRHGFRPSRPR